MYVCMCAALSYSLTDASSSVSKAGAYPLDDHVVVILGAADLVTYRPDLDIK